MIIGLTGYAESGKDTVGKILCKRFGFTRVALADSVKEFALAINPLVSVSGWSGHCGLREVVEKLGWDAAKREPSVRIMLQKIGTEGGRKVIGEQCWLMAIETKLQQMHGKHVVLTDIRFPNEEEWLREQDWNVELWRIVRPGHDNKIGKKHPSESSITELSPDRIIVNHSTIEALEETVAAEFSRFDEWVKAEIEKLNRPYMQIISVGEIKVSGGSGSSDG